MLALDYFMGNRTPYRDRLLRGACLGLSLGHDLAALYRAARYFNVLVTDEPTARFLLEEKDGHAFYESEVDDEHR